MNRKVFETLLAKLMSAADVFPSLLRKSKHRHLHLFRKALKCQEMARIGNVL